MVVLGVFFLSLHWKGAAVRGLNTNFSLVSNPNLKLGLGREHPHFSKMILQDLCLSQALVSTLIMQTCDFHIFVTLNSKLGFSGCFFCVVMQVREHQNSGSGKAMKVNAAKFLTALV